MTHDDDESGELPVLSSQEMFRMIMQEIADTNKELKANMMSMKQVLKEDIAGLDGKLSKKIDSVGSELHTLRLEVHQNQSAFITNNLALDKRVTTLEVAVFQ